MALERQRGRPEGRLLLRPDGPVLGPAGPRGPRCGRARGTVKTRPRENIASPSACFEREDRRRRHSGRGAWAPVSDTESLPPGWPALSGAAGELGRNGAPRGPSKPGAPLLAGSLIPHPGEELGIPQASSLCFPPVHQIAAGDALGGALIRSADALGRATVLSYLGDEPFPHWPSSLSALFSVGF